MDPTAGPSFLVHGRADTVSCLAVLPDGTLASGSIDKTIRLWNINTECTHILRGHTGPVLDLAALADGTLVSGRETRQSGCGLRAASARLPTRTG